MPSVISRLSDRRHNGEAILRDEAQPLDLILGYIVRKPRNGRELTMYDTVDDGPLELVMPEDE